MTLAPRDQRTAPLALLINPHRGQELVSRFQHTLTVKGLSGALTLTIAFVPDRDIPATGALDAYLESLGAYTWDSLELFCGIVLEDIADTLVPLLVFVEVERAPEPGKARHHAAMRRTQPTYKPTPFMETLLRA